MHPLLPCPLQTASKNAEFESLHPLTHLLILAGDADEEMTSPKKSVQLQVGMGWAIKIPA